MVHTIAMLLNALRTGVYKMNEDIFYASKNQIFDHFECSDCGMVFLGHDSYEAHCKEKHQYEWIVGSSREKISRVKNCECNFVFDSYWDGTPVYKCQKCGWLMFNE